MLPHSPEGKETGQSAEERVGWAFARNQCYKECSAQSKEGSCSHSSATQLQVKHLFCWPQAATLGKLDCIQEAPWAGLSLRKLLPSNVSPFLSHPSGFISLAVRGGWTGSLAYRTAWEHLMNQGKRGRPVGRHSSRYSLRSQVSTSDMQVGLQQAFLVLLQRDKMKCTWMWHFFELLPGMWHCKELPGYKLGVLLKAQSTTCTEKHVEHSPA